MSPQFDSSTNRLLPLVQAGDQAATNDLLMRYRTQLRRIVEVRLDRRIRPRVDPSDIVQETLVIAASRLVDYAKEKPIAFFPWLRAIAIEQVIQHHRKHISSQRRSVKREISSIANLPDHSSIELTQLLADEQSAERAQPAEAIVELLDLLKPQDREVLVLRFLERLSITETAEVLQLGENAVKSRQRRALERFNELIQRGRPNG